MIKSARDGWMNPATGQVSAVMAVTALIATTILSTLGLL